MESKYSRIVFALFLKIFTFGKFHQLSQLLWENNYLCSSLRTVVLAILSEKQKGPLFLIRHFKNWNKLVGVSIFNLCNIKLLDEIMIIKSIDFVTQRIVWSSCQKCSSFFTPMLKCIVFYSLISQVQHFFELLFLICIFYKCRILFLSVRRQLHSSKTCLFHDLLFPYICLIMWKYVVRLNSLLRVYEGNRDINLFFELTSRIELIFLKFSATSNSQFLICDSIILINTILFNHKSYFSRFLKTIFSMLYETVCSTIVVNIIGFISLLSIKFFYFRRDFSRIVKFFDHPSASLAEMICVAIRIGHFDTAKEILTKAYFILAIYMNGSYFLTFTCVKDNLLHVEQLAALMSMCMYGEKRDKRKGAEEINEVRKFIQNVWVEKAVYLLYFKIFPS
uniref:Pentatricopeptide repeat-containing protein n=1 Tax=Heterorhabditis bacteriophora TaxID=37862 RepID=A0A1I7WJ00_HETBA